MAAVGLLLAAGSGEPVSAAQRGQPSAAHPSFLRWSAKTKTAFLTLIVASNQDNGGFNFDGSSDGGMIVKVPLGARVVGALPNREAVPGSFLITAYAKRTSPSPPAAVTGAFSPDPTAGTVADKVEKAKFTAAKAGRYAIVCAVPGHALAGQWATLDVVRAAPRATITLRR